MNKVLVAPRGLFATGTFDQYKRDISYATMAQAFQSLVRQVSGTSETELRTRREALREALGPNGPLIVGLIHELELVIGEQPPVARAITARCATPFPDGLRRFIGVFGELSRQTLAALISNEECSCNVLDRESERVITKVVAGIGFEPVTFRLSA